MRDFTKSAIAVLCLASCFAGWGTTGLSASFRADGDRPVRPRCEVKRIGQAESVPAAVVSPLRSYGSKMAASVVAQDWFEKAKAKLMKRGEAHTNVVDVLMAFDRSAKAWLADNGYGSCDEFAAICLRKMNWVLANSGLLEDFSFRLAGIAEVDVDVPESYHAVEGYYDSYGYYEEYEYTDLSRMLEDATGDSAGLSSKWAALRAERELVCADVVSVLVASEESGTVGLAYSLDRMSIATPEYFADHAYSVVCIGSVASDNTQVHEIGHLMGAGHSDQMDPDYYRDADGVSLLGPQLFPYSAGMYFNEADGDEAAGAERDWLWRYTVMGYNYPGPGWGTDVYGDPIFAAGEPCFSSPNLFSENGVAKGDALHDNARTLRETYAFVANYRVRKATIRVVAPEGGGTASGQGAYMPGQTVKLVAKPSAGYVFAGWYSAYDEVSREFSEPFERGSADYRTASQQFVAGSDGMTIYARFVTPAVDAAALSVNAGDVTTGVDGSLSLRLGPWVESLSTPKLSVKGLPSGLKYDAKTLQITGIAKKPGVYTVTVQATNASVKKATTASTATFRVIVPNFESPMLPKLRPETDAYGTAWCGLAFATNRIDCAPIDGWTVKVSGLPSGLKFDAKNCVVGGVPTKEGTFTVTFTASKKGEKSQGATITLNVKARPSWAVGAFSGEVGNGESATAEAAADKQGTVSLTIAAAGKISGKILEGGKTWTLSAASFSRVEHVEHVEDGVVFHATVIAKSGKLLATNEIAVAAVDGIGVLTGTFELSNSQTFELTSYQNLWKRADTKASQPVFKKNIVVEYYALGVSGDKNNTVKITFKKDGAVSFSGKKDGVSVSGSSQVVLVGRDGNDAPLYKVTFYAPPKKDFKGWCETFPVKLTTDKQNIVTAVSLGGEQHDKVQL